jgi:hypothetical protein
MKLLFRLLALVSAVGCGAGLASAASPIGLPPAQWIWAAGDPRPTTARFTRSFPAPARVQSAVVIGACDGRMMIRLNGEPVGEVAGRERGMSFAVMRHIRPGENVLALEASSGTNAAVAAILELVLDTGKHEWIVTDGSWSAAADGGRERKPVARLGRVDAPGQLNPFDPSRAVDAYNSWTLAKGANRATDPADIRVPPGFAVDLLRSAQPGEDSWVALAFDPQGRITVAREKQPGLLRLTLRSPPTAATNSPSSLKGERAGVRGDSADPVARVELINTNLLECRGLLYAHGALYVHANNSKALFRLSDTNGDNQFDEVRELLRTEGGVGHGRNHLRLGPDGGIYVVTGDDIALPPQPAASSPFKRFTDPPWIPGPLDRTTFGPGDRLLTGYIARMDAEGSRFEVIAGGLRNPLDVAFNEDGEMFAYDADNERDIGNPWYKPSRVHHIVSGGDYGWRRGLGILPSYCPDVLPTMHDVGLGSPTGVEFGTASRFPEQYRRALFIADWAYGRILALHLEPQGASYTATREDFATGRPLNVSDMVIGPDGAMYFTTGGRQTQSGLYRVRYAGAPTRRDELRESPSSASGDQKSGTRVTRPSGSGAGVSPVVPGRLAPESAENRGRDARSGSPEAHPTALRQLRHQLESFHGRDNSANAGHVIATVWPHLGHRDRWVHHAARVALETVDAKHWQARALAETDASRALSALLALARAGTVNPAALTKLNGLRLDALTETEQLDALRVYELLLAPRAAPHAGLAKAAREKLDALYPSSSRWVNRELCKLLVNLRSPTVIAKTISLLGRADTQEDVVHFLFFLRHAEGAWTLEQRRVFFSAVRKAEQGQGAQNYTRTLRDIKTATAASLVDSERTALAPLLEDKSVVFAALAGHAAPRLVRDWYFEELESVLDRAARGRSFESGKAAFAKAQCILCHRVGTGPEAGGLIGPDLTAVASRFSRRDILDATMNPSRAMDDKFRSAVIRLKNGESLSGTVEAEDAGGIVLRPSPLSEETITVAAPDILTRELSVISPMPTGLLNVLEREEILDLLAFLESGGDAAHAAFRRDATKRR